MNNLIIYIGGILVAFFALIAGLYKAKKSGKEEAKNEAIQDSINETKDIKQDIEDHRSDDIDVLRVRLRKYTRED